MFDFSHFNFLQGEENKALELQVNKTTGWNCSDWILGNILRSGETLA